MADGLAYKFFCVKPRRGVKITGRWWSKATLGDEGDAFVATRRKNPCQGGPQVYKSRRADRIQGGATLGDEGDAFVRLAELPPFWGRVGGEAGESPPSLRSDRISVTPSGFRILSWLICRGFASLHRLPVFSPPLRGSIRSSAILLPKFMGEV